jgi:hypothetical protein
MKRLLKITKSKIDFRRKIFLSVRVRVKKVKLSGKKNRFCKGDFEFYKPENRFCPYFERKNIGVA